MTPRLTSLRTLCQRSLAALLLSGLADAAAQPAPELLTLPQAISLALDRNLRLQSVGLAIETVETSVESAKNEYQPDLSFRISESIGLSAPGGESIFDGDGQWSDSTSASLSASYSIYDGGARAASLALAQAQLTAAQRDFDRERQSLLFDVVSFYFQALLRGKEIDIQVEERNQRIAELERIRFNVDNRIRTNAELLRQQAQVSDSDRLVAQARNNYARSLYSLKAILRLSPADSIVCEEPASPISGPETLPPPELAISLASLQQRVDLEAQRARLEAAEQNVRIATSGKLPSVAASASLGTSYSSQADRAFHDQFFRERPSASGGISVSLPIFDRQRTALSAVRSRIALRQQELSFESLELNARTALYQANDDYGTAQLQLAASLQQLASAENALEAEQARFDAGAATLLDLNSLRTIRLDAAVAVERARFALVTSRLAIAYEDGSIESFLQNTL